MSGAELDRLRRNEWSSYSKISQLKEFEHKTVNHSYHFVDPESGAYTNGIEGAWTQLKRKLKDMNGCSRLYLQSYIDEFLWRHNNCMARGEVYDSIMSALSVYWKNVPGYNQFVVDAEEASDDEIDGTWTEVHCL